MKNHSFKFLIFALLCILAAISRTASAQLSYNSQEDVYFQTFDALPASGMTFTWSDNVTIPGWYAGSSATSFNNTLGISTGSTTSGNIYSFGLSNATDRALGSIASGSTNWYYGLQAVNNTGTTITGFTISYTGEQWRNSAAAAQSLSFQYSIGATTLKNGTYVSVPAIGFNSPVTGGTAGLLNGNLTANQTVIGPVTVNNINWLPGTSLWLRFTDLDDAGFDHGLAIDDFKFSTSGSIPAYDPPAGYYDPAAGLSEDALSAALHSIVSNNAVVPNTSSTNADVIAALKYLYEDPSSSSKIKLTYSGVSVAKTDTSWSKAFLWPSSRGVSSSANASTDLFNLRPAYTSVNSGRGSKFFDNSNTADSAYRMPAIALAASDTSTDSDSWQPSADERGDIARALFYMDIRYNGGDGNPTDLALDNVIANTSGMAVLSTLVQWSHADPVSEEERRRNASIYSLYQHNRNPFVDHPEYVDSIFGALVVEADDLDLDGIPNSWENTYSLNPQDSSDANADTDSDGLSNYEEYWMGSDPQDPNSPLKFVVDGSYLGTTEDGSLTHPFKTIRGAIEALGTDELRAIMVEPGTYTERPFASDKNEVHLFSTDGAAQTIIDGEQLDSSVVRLYNFRKASLVGFTIQNAETSFYGAGLRVETSAGTAYIANNIITGNTSTNVSSGGGGIYLKTADGSRVVNNFITGNNALRGGGVLFAGGNPQFWFNTVVANTATGGNGGGLSALQGVHPDVRDNIIWANVGSLAPQLHQIDSSYAQSNILQGATAGSSNIDSDPQFVSPALGDYHIKGGSPARSRGTRLPVASDFDGENHGSTYDIGADFYIDTDNDGLPDSWENNYGLNTQNPADATDPAIGYGTPPISSYNAGKNPYVIEGSVYNFTAAAGTDGIDLSWNADLNAARHFVTYYISSWVGSVSSQTRRTTFTTTATTFHDPLLVPGQTYFYQLRAQYRPRSPMKRWVSWGKPTSIILAKVNAPAPVTYGNLWTYLNSSQGITKDQNDTVSLWADQKGTLGGQGAANNATASGTDTPIYLAAQFNGNPALDFHKATLSPSMKLAGAVGDTATASMSIFVVAKNSGTGVSPILSTGITEGWMLRYDDNNTLKFIHNTQAEPTAANTASLAINSSVAILELRQTAGTSVKLGINGKMGVDKSGTPQLISKFTPAKTPVTTVLGRLGVAFDNNALNTNATVAEVIIFDGVVDATTRREIYTRLSNTYAIGLYDNDPFVSGVTAKLNNASVATGTRLVHPEGNMKFSVTATDDSNVSRVEFYQGGTLIGTSTTPVGTVFSVSIPVPVKGNFTVSAKAFDDLENSATGGAFTYSVVENILPGAPTKVVATAGSSLVNLSWTAASNATSYSVQRSTSASGPFTEVGTTANTTFSDSSVTNDVTYFYKVIAINGAGRTESAVTPGVTPRVQTQPPGPPTNVVATAGPALIKLTWTAASGANSYIVQRSTPDTNHFVDVGTTAITIFTDSSVTNPNPYFYKIVAVNSVGRTESAITPAVTPDIPSIPEPPGLPDDPEFTKFPVLPTNDFTGDPFGLTSGNGQPPPPNTGGGTGGGIHISPGSQVSNQAPRNYPNTSNTTPIVANGDFSTPSIDHSKPPGDYGLYYGSVSSWEAISGDLIELQDRSLKDDGNYVELDSKYATSSSQTSDHGIKQDVQLSEGSYSLSFNYRHRDDQGASASKNEIEVKLKIDSQDPVVLGSLADLSKDWKSCQMRFEVTGGGTTATLSFDIKGQDTADSLGAYVDSIFISPTSTPPGQYTVPFSEASGSRYRKIGLNGRPMPDEKPQQTAESDQEKEETYIDALTLGLNHSVTDIHVPIPGSDLALTVRRNTTSDVWNLKNGLRPNERLDQAFGAGWSSNLSAALHVVYDPFVTYYYVTDQNGAQHRFLFENNIYVPMPSDTRENGDYLCTLERIGDTFVFTDRYKTKMTFVYATYYAIPKSREPDADPAQVENDYYFRVQQIADRYGNGLIYKYDQGSTTLIPSGIAWKPSIENDPLGKGHWDQAIVITQSNGHVDTIKDPKGNVVHYYYKVDPSSGATELDYVENQELERTTYGYNFAVETDLTPSSVNDGHPTDQLHLDVSSIKDPRNNTWTFNPEFDHSKQNYSTAAGYYTQTGGPRYVKSVLLPDNRITEFTNNSRVALKAGASDIFRKNTVTDAHLQGSQDAGEQGHTITYTFGGPEIQNVAGLYPDTPAWAVPKIVLYKTMEIKYETGKNELYTFDSTAGLALKSVKDLSDNTTTYTYGDSYTLQPGLQTAFPTGLFGKYQDPTEQKNAFGKSKTFHYSDSFRIMDQMQDEKGRVTKYKITPSNGNRENEQIFDVGGTVPTQQTDFQYTDSRFPGVVTKKTVKALGFNVPTNSPSLGAWYQDLVTDYTLDASGRIETETVGNATTNQFTKSVSVYDKNGNKLTAKDRLGRITWFYYDKFNRLKQVFYYDGASKFIDYDKCGNKTREIDERGFATLYSYDEMNRLKDQARDMNRNSKIERGTLLAPKDLVTSFTYNAVGSKKTQTDSNGNVTTFEYDYLQRLSATITPGLQEAPGGYRTEYDYSGPNSGATAFDSSGFKPTTITDIARNFHTIITYDELYRETSKSIEYKPGVFSETTTGYDEVGNVTSVTDDLEHSTGTTYDALNRPKVTTFADTRYVTNTYTATGLKWLVEDERHKVTETQYDAVGRPNMVVQPMVFDALAGRNGKPTTQTFYDEVGNIKATINPLGKQWDYTYDRRNRKRTETQPSVVDATDGSAKRPMTDIRYDAAGNVEYAIDARGYWSKTTYDDANRAVEVLAPPVLIYGKQGAVRPITSKKYDANGNVLTATDANLHVTNNTYDALNRLKTTADAENILVQNEYDSAGNLTQVTDGKLQVTKFAYDGLNRNTEIKDFANKSTIFTYDGVNKISRTDALTQETIYGYDPRNRLWTVTYTDRPDDDRTYGYDEHGNLTSVTEPGKGGLADVGNTYDALNRLETETSSGLTHTYKYDLAGNRRTASYGGTGRLLTSDYDNLNRLSTLTEGSRTTGYGYDLNGNTFKKTLPNGELVTTNYDGLNRTYVIAGFKPNGGGYNYQYINGYDESGNVRWVNEYYRDLSNSRDIQMDYQKNNRLWHEMVKDATGYTKTTTFGYDPAHNHTDTTVSSDSGSATVTSGFVFNKLNQLTSYTESGGSTSRNVTYGYDDAGNRHTRTENGATDTYSYDYEQRLVSLGKNTTGGAGTYAYTYDYRTRRVGRTEGNATTKLVFSGGTSVQEYNGAGAAVQSSLTAEYVRGSDWGGGVGGVLYSLRASIPSFSHYDRRGDVTEKTNAAGAVTYQASYQPFGLHPNDFQSTPDRQKANTKEEDPTGLLNEGMRYRDLETGAFITRDPAGFVDGPNLYTYVNQNPWTKFDPEGLFWSFVVDAAFIGYDAYQYHTGQISEGEHAVRQSINAIALAADVASGGFGGGTAVHAFALAGHGLELAHAAEAIKGAKELAAAAKQAQITANAVSSSAQKTKDSTDKQVGSYTNTHESGKTYSGKGTKDRMDISAKEKAEMHNDPVVKQEFKPAESQREAFKAEDDRIQANGGAGPQNPNTYNKINSPGAKYNAQDKAVPPPKAVTQPQPPSS